MSDEPRFRLATATVTADGTLILSGWVRRRSREGPHQPSYRIVLVDRRRTAEQSFPATIHSRSEAGGTEQHEVSCTLPLPALTLPPTEPLDVYFEPDGGNARSRVVVGGSWLPYATKFRNLSLRRRPTS